MRSFVAIELPDTLRRSLAARIETLSADIEPYVIRWVRPEGIHLTLKFLGNVNAGEMESARKVVSEVVSRFSAFTYSVGGLGCFPSQRRPRVIWVGVRDQSGELAALYGGLEQGFAANGFASENRDFHPHLTLGRVRREARQADQRALSEVLGRVEPVALGEYHVKEICIFRSDLKPSGAVYTKLLSAPLGDAV